MINEVKNKINRSHLDHEKEMFSNVLDNKLNKIDKSINTNIEPKDLINKENTSSYRNIDVISHIPINITVELGTAKIKVKELLSLAKKNIITLDKLAGESLNILANGVLIATGEIVVVDHKYGIRIVQIINSITTTTDSFYSK